MIWNAFLQYRYKDNGNVYNKWELLDTYGYCADKDEKEPLYHGSSFVQ